MKARTKMKIRKGFVSNSSSSSFIVGLPKKPDTVKELQNIMFGDFEFIEDSWGDEVYPTKKIAEDVFFDIKVAEDVETWHTPRGIVTREQAEQEMEEWGLHPWSVSMRGGSSTHGFNQGEIKGIFGENYKEVEEYKEWRKLWDEVDSINIKDMRASWDKEYELKDKANKIARDFFMNSRKDIFDAPVVFITEYADDCGSGFMEHGEIFRNLPHIRISKH